MQKIIGSEVNPHSSKQMPRVKSRDMALKVPQGKRQNARGGWGDLHFFVGRTPRRGGGEFPDIEGDHPVHIQSGQETFNVWRTSHTL